MSISDVRVARATSQNHGTLGIFWAIYGIVCLVKAAWIVMNASVFTLMWGALLNRVPNPYPWMSFFHFALIGIVALLIFTAVFSFLAAISLLQRAQPGRMVALAASILGIISGPLGIVLGVYTLILLLSQPADETQNRFATAA